MFKNLSDTVWNKNFICNCAYGYIINPGKILFSIWPFPSISGPLIPCFLGSIWSRNNFIFYILHINFTSALSAFLFQLCLCSARDEIYSFFCSTLCLTLTGFAVMMSPKLVCRILARSSSNSQEPFAFWREISCIKTFFLKPLWEMKEISHGKLWSHWDHHPPEVSWTRNL